MTWVGGVQVEVNRQMVDCSWCVVRSTWCVVSLVASTRKRSHGLVTRSGSQISRLAPLVWDDEWGGEWGVGCGVWVVEKRYVVRSS